MSSLNEGQLSAFEGILQCISKKQNALLIGTAGTGKSYTAARILSEAINTGLIDPKRTIALAPTHRAKKVLNGFLDDNDLGIQVYTIHSALGIGLDIDSETGKQKATRGDKWDRKIPPIELADFCLVDESSMIAEDLADLLLYDYGHKGYLFLGDNLQLAPVNPNKNESQSKVFGLIRNQFELTQPMRNDGSISTLVECAKNSVRCAMESKLIGNSHPLDGFRFENYSDLADDSLLFRNRGWIDRYIPKNIEHFQNESCKLLAFTNSTVDKLNESVRQQIHGSFKLPPFIAGEKLITNKPVSDGSSQIYPNGTELIIESIGETTQQPLKETYKYISLDVIPVDGLLRYQLSVIHPDDQKRFNADLKALAKNATNQIDSGSKRNAWGMYYKLLNSSHDVSHAFAMTIHKSQGSSIDFPWIVYDWSYLLKSDVLLHNRLAYVAVSRAKHGLILGL